MKTIQQYLKKNGEQLDTEIAVATGISLATVRLHLAELTAKYEVVACQTTRFVKDKKIEGTIYRIAGYTPPAAPGRKSKAQLNLS
jgi:transcription initiation factor IIE alpha subunit